MKFANYNTERKVKSNIDTYLKALFFGLLFAGVFIGGGKLLILIFKAIFKNWIWIVAIIGGLLLIKKFFFRKKIQNEN